MKQAPNFQINPEVKFPEEVVMAGLKELVKCIEKYSNHMRIRLQENLLEYPEKGSQTYLCLNKKYLQL